MNKNELYNEFRFNKNIDKTHIKIEKSSYNSEKHLTASMAVFSLKFMYDEYKENALSPLELIQNKVLEVENEIKKYKENKVV